MKHYMNVNSTEETKLLNELYDLLEKSKEVTTKLKELGDHSLTWVIGQRSTGLIGDHKFEMFMESIGAKGISKLKRIEYHLDTSIEEMQFWTSKSNSKIKQ